MKKIGITTTVPFEVLYAAGYQPIDLINIFVCDENYQKYIDVAEKHGFPKSLCACIKGIYGVCELTGVKEVLGVVEGDCSNTKALLEVLVERGVKSIPFGFPHSRSYDDIKKSMDDLMKTLGTTPEAVEKIRQELFEIRDLADQIDKLTYIEEKATGFENHVLQVSMSDFFGNIEEAKKILTEKIDEIKNRESKHYKLRLGYIGVPPITGDLYEFVNLHDGQIMYNEVQREFIFPRAREAKDIYEQYLDFTYPYDLEGRLEIIKKEIKERRLDGIIHYNQAFCYRAIEDIIIKSKLDVPVLNIEGDKLNTLDARTKLRIEAFMDMLIDRKDGI